MATPLKSETKQISKPAKKPSLSQALKYVKSLSAKDQERLFIEMKRKQVAHLTKKIKASTKGLSLTMEEIQAEVDSVRASRYANKTGK